MAIKRVKVEDLKEGMYVHDLNCGWLQHGFLRQQFLLKSTDQIAKMKKQGLDEIYIDTEKGGDVAGAPTQGEIDQAIAKQMKDTAAGGPALAPARVSQREESAAAKRIMGDAIGVVDGLLTDVRLGKQLDPAKAKPLVKAMHASVLRNPGALISLSRLKSADTYTFQHSVSICALLVSFCQSMGMDAATVEEAGLGGLLHDVGKMKVPNEILNKPGKLTDDEFTVMKSHASMSMDLLEGVPGVSRMVIQIAGEHHEKMAGGGYPRGIAGEQISQIGRMTAIVDVYDALTSNRVYHKAKEPSEVLKKLLEWSGSHLDGDLVQQYIRTLGIYPVGSLVRLSNDRLAVVVEQSEDLLRPTVRIVYDIGRKLKLQPRDVVLTPITEQIVDYEEPADWKLDPTLFL
ncbi:HD-GYP domain-containing protein [Geothrix sp. PMB-07]|uniref:HD-GYP domain-containing protein n=1 Tax=Geothrix sp. PMB-07 TaxID=3068640 RepID=UPI0027405F7D|nr:HD-GYP domain-containing protein [Geothrix sp. PMB-07]WLT32605.1 HD-GYP domain-containing protein [Geothrix sp. PMB-07]